MNFNLTKEQQLILMGLVISIVVGLAVTAYRHYFAEPSGKIVIEEPAGKHLLNTQAPTIMVHVCGAVRREGVYKLKAGDRVVDALRMAGGTLPSADLSALNLAEPVKDGVKVVVPVKRTVGEEVGGESGNRVFGARSSLVNINTADEKTLDSLPGIGPATAKAIIEYRKTNGPFTRIEQIMEIPRFGKSKFERIKDKISI